MFTSHDRLTPAPVRQDAPCMCARGGACSSFAPGHAVHLIQARLVSATPSEWVDAIATSVSEGGDVLFHTIADDAPREVWNGAGLTEAITAGSPLSYHPRYHAISAAGRLFNVAPSH